MESNLQNKLQQFSADPPERVWSKIADALDSEETFSQRLYQYEEQPPAAVWQNLEQALNTAVPAKAVPFTTRFKRPIRYAAVACFLAVVLVTVTLSVKRTEAGALDTAGNSTVPAAQTTGINTQLEPTNNSTQTTTPFEANNESVAKTETVYPNKPDASQAKKGNSVTASVSSKNYTKTKTAGPVYSSLNDYVFFSDGDGRMRRVSKKVADFVICKDNDTKCEQRLKELRQKMATKATTSDFTGILEMLRQLQ